MLFRSLRETLEAIPLLAAALARDARVEPGVVALGASLGAPLAAISAARAPEISQLILVHGFGRIPLVIERQLARGPGRGPGVRARAVRALAPLVSRAAWAASGLPDPEDEVRALRPGQSVFWVEAENDSFIPSQAAASLREVIGQSGAKVETLRTPGDHVQPGSVQLLREIGAQARAWLERVRRACASPHRARKKEKGGREPRGCSNDPEQGEAALQRASGDPRSHPRSGGPEDALSRGQG